MIANYKIFHSVFACLFGLVMFIFTFKFVVLFTKVWSSSADSVKFWLFFLCLVCFCATLLRRIFLVWIVWSFKPLGIRTLLFKSVCTAAVWFDFTLPLTCFTTAVFSDCSLNFFLKVLFFFCLFGTLFFLHGFILFFFLPLLSSDVHFCFTVKLVVVVMLAAVVVGTTGLLVTGGWVVSLNFLGGGLVGLSVESSTVTEMTDFIKFLCSTLQPHFIFF